MNPPRHPSLLSLAATTFIAVAGAYSGATETFLIIGYPRWYVLEEPGNWLAGFTLLCAMALRRTRPRTARFGLAICGAWLVWLLAPKL